MQWLFLAKNSKSVISTLTKLKVWPQIGAFNVSLPTIADVDIRLLKVFRAVVESGGFSGAQAALNVGASTISIQIQNLEQRLGFRLCSRGRSGFRLTPEGQRVYAAIERLFESIEAFRLDLYDSRDALSGEVRIAMIDTLLSHPDGHLIDAFRRFRSRGKNCRLTIEVMRVIDIEASVANGTFDLGIGVFSRLPVGVKSEILFAEKHHLYCAATHQLVTEGSIDTITVAEVVGYDYVHRGNLEFDGLKAGPGFVNLGAKTANIEAIAMLILTGLFVGYLPEHFAKPLVESGRLLQIPLDKMSDSAPISMIFSKRKELPRVLSAFLEDMRAVHPA